MSTVIGAMEAYLKLNIDDFEKNLKEAKKQVESVSAGFDVMTAVGDKMTSVGNKLTLGLTTPIIGLGTACIKTTADFDSAMSKVSAISGATGDDLASLRAKAKEMGEATKFSATESAEAFTYMAMAGWDTQQMLDGISGIMNLAAADGLDLATTSDIVTDALTAFGLKASDASHFSDVLAKASAAANTNVSMLGESFKYVAPVAGSMGYSVEDVSVALGLMANSGIKAGQAGTSLRAALTRMAKPTKDAAEMMDTYGISISNSDGSMKSLSEVMGILRDNMGSLTEAEQIQAATTIFGQESMSGMLAIINASDEDFNKLTEAIDNADGTAQNMADTMNDNLSGQLTLLKSQIEGIAIQFGEILVPILRDAVSAFSKVLTKVSQMSPETQKLIIKIAAVAAAIGPVLSVTGKAVSTIGKLGSAFSNMKALVMAANASLTAAGTSIGAIAAPIIAVVAVIAVLVAAFKHLWDTNEEFRTRMTEIWNSVVAKFQEFGQGIVDRLNSLGFDFENFTEVLKALWDGFCNFLAPIFEGAFSLVASILSTALDVLLGIADVFIAVFKGDWQGAWEAVKGISATIWNGIVDVFSIVLNTLKGIADVVLGWFGTNWSSVWSSIKSFFVGIWNSIVSFFQGIVNSLKSAISALGTFITTTIPNACNSAKQSAIDAFNAMVTGVSTAITNVKTAIQTGFTNAVQFIQNLAGQAATWGSHMVQGFADGVKSAMSSLIDTVKGMADKVKSFLHFTRPDEGPLRDYETWMPDMVQGLAKTLEASSPGLIDKVKQLSGSIADSMNLGTYQVALAGAGGDIRAGGTAFTGNDYSALGKDKNGSTDSRTQINIEKIEVRNDRDLEMVTQGLYNKQDQNLRALGRRNL